MAIDVSGQHKKNDRGYMEEMTFLYTALAIFDKSSCKYGKSWNDYIDWSKLTHLTEVVSLDGMLNESLVEPDYNNAGDWNFIHSIGQLQTGFFTDLEYVLRKCEKHNSFNLLAVVINPGQDCKNIVPEGYEFMGYELLDDMFGVSVLTNCRSSIGNEPFSPGEVNKYGLIDDYLAACAIKKRVWENNPEGSHSKTNVIAVWRHKTIGRKIEGMNMA